MSFQDDNPPVAASDASAPPPDLGELAASLARKVRGLVQDHLELATLRQAEHSLARGMMADEDISRIAIPAGSPPEAPLVRQATDAVLAGE